MSYGFSPPRGNLLRSYDLSIETSNPDIDAAELDTCIRAAVAFMAEDIDSEGHHSLCITVTEANNPRTVVSEIDYTPEPEENEEEDEET